jgi:sugar phosphate isomerase/epimerase
MDAPFPLALQLYTVRDLCAKDLEGTLRAVAKAGYRAVELAGTYGRAPAEMRAALDRCGLRAISAHLGLDRLLAEPAAVAKECAVYGVGYVACSGPARERRDAEGYRAWAADLDKAGAALRRHGLRLCHHNHAWEFEKHDGRSGLRWIMEETSAKNVGFQLDVYWAAKGGEDPVAWMERLGSRCPLLHLKDIDAAGDFAPVGAGELDFARILAVAEGMGVEGHVVEQDTCKGSAIDAISTSFKNLKRLAPSLAG